MILISYASYFITYLYLLLFLKTVFTVIKINTSEHKIVQLDIIYNDI